MMSMSVTASCADCHRRAVGDDELTVTHVARLAAWERTRDGRWWCTECQARNHRTPFLHQRARAAADPNVENLRRLQAKAERSARLETMFVWVLVGVLIGVFALVLVLAVL